MLPFVSVLVPVRNEERYIERCLYAIAAQDLTRGRYEVLVIDGESDDRTREVVARFAAETDIDLRMLSNPARLPAAALNIGLAAARGDVIVRIDGHATPAGDFLRRALEALERTGADCVGGIITSEGDTRIGRSIALAMSSRFGVGGAAFRTGGDEGPVDTVAFGAYRRDVFGRIGGFREDIPQGEDDELNYRLLDHGGSIILVPELRCTYTVRGDLRSLWRQYFAYGRAKPSVLRLHPAQAQPRQLMPAAFVAALAGSAMLALAGERRPLRWLVGAYRTAMLPAVLLAARDDVAAAPALPLVFPVMHIAYGTGTLVGAASLALAARGVPLPGRRSKVTDA